MSEPVLNRFDFDQLYERVLAAIEPVMFDIVLKHTHGNRLRAAELLGIHRGTLRERLRHYNINEENDQ